MQEAFTYCWTDKKTQKLYVGVHLGSETDGYICSCKLMLDEYFKRPEDFSRQVIARGFYADMIKFETSILKTVDAAKSNFFYNGHNGDGKFYNKGHSEETKKKLKIARNKRTDKPREGKPFTAEAKIKLSEAAKKRSMTSEGKTNIKQAAKISSDRRKERLLNDPEYAKQYSEMAKRGWEKRKMREK
jgi:hypothetical protein